MLTVKRIDAPHAVETVFLAKEVRYVPPRPDDGRKAAPGAVIGARVYIVFPDDSTLEWGVHSTFYVMNDNGATVAKYTLDAHNV